MEHIRVLVVDNEPSEIAPILDRLKSFFEKKNVVLSYTLVENREKALQHLQGEEILDLVLLDIIGVKYKEVITDIQTLHPYLPIVMISKHPVLREVIECIGLGARSFIFKTQLESSLDHFTGQSQSREESSWLSTVRKIRKLVEEYRPIKRMLESSLEIGQLRKRADRDSIIKDQITFLRYVHNKSKIADYFPGVYGQEWEEGGYTLYEMPYFRMKSLRHLIFVEADKETCLKISRRVIELVLEFAFTNLYTQDVRTDIYDGFVQETYFKKYTFRLEQTKSLLGRLKKNGPSPGIEAYEKVLVSNQIEIDGRNLRNPTDILRELENDGNLIRRLKPPFLCIIHGDLHFDNILVDDRLLKKIRIKLIDPRGFSHTGYAPGTGDVAYDVGKLLHSAHGHYDFIHAGNLITNILSFEYQGEKVKVPPLERQEWATVPQKGGGSGAIITSHKKVVPPWAWAVFDDLGQYIREWIENSRYPQKDPNWWLRAKFNEAMHFCTMGKFHIQEDVGRAIAIQIRGTELMNEFFQDYNNGVFAA